VVSETANAKIGSSYDDKVILAGSPVAARRNQATAPDDRLASLGKPMRSVRRYGWGGTGIDGVFVANSRGNLRRFAADEVPFPVDRATDEECAMRTIRCPGTRLVDLPAAADRSVVVVLRRKTASPRSGIL